MFTQFTNTLSKMKAVKAKDIVDLQRSASTAATKSIPVPQIKEMTEKVNAAYFASAHFVADQYDKTMTAYNSMFPDVDKWWKV